MNTLILTVAVFFLSSSFTYGQEEGTFIIASGEWDGHYEMAVIFNRDISHQVLESVNNCLIQNKNLFLKNTNQNSIIKLDDKTTFHLKLIPGELRILFKKTDNPDPKYNSLIRKCEDLKEKINNANQPSHRHTSLKDIK